MRIRNRRLLSLLLVALASAAALALAACGGGDDSGDARELLRESARNPIPKATLSVDLQIEAEGSEQLSQPVNFKVTGPYDFSNAQTPKTDWDLTASGAGQSLTAKLLATGDNAFIGLQGQNYEVGSEAFKQQIQALPAALQQLRTATGGAKLDTGSWLKDPQTDGEEDVAGAETTKITGDVDIVKMLTDVSRAAQQAQGQGSQTPAPTQQQIDEFKKVIQDPKLEVFVNEDDKTIRRAVMRLDFTVPEDQRSQVQGATGGSLTLTVQFANVGQDVQVSAPADAKPLEELQKQLPQAGGGLGGLGGSGSSGSGGSGGSGSGGSGSGDSGSGGSGGSDPSSDAFKKYADCLEKAGRDRDKVQECSKLLR